MIYLIFFIAETPITVEDFTSFETISRTILTGTKEFLKAHTGLMKDRLWPVYHATQNLVKSASV